ncbi:hypothetical protein FSP39_021325 [Pinctada imbricata]|uniref:Uncharacterized protein n=1 Tax=Pinctada imbricata TaxID=66713 RepID=A0AA89BP33_PINIB|nr:hypothetical protein FSP39_021325 [Pinctada imbricata]
MFQLTKKLSKHSKSEDKLNSEKKVDHNALEIDLISRIMFDSCPILKLLALECSSFFMGKPHYVYANGGAGTNAGPNGGPGAGPGAGGVGPGAGGPGAGGVGPGKGGPKGPKPTTPPPTTTTPAVPTTTVEGEGMVCFTTQNCEVGCCFGVDGQLLDTSTYGPGGPKEGKDSGRCRIRSPKLGDRCDDFCPCSAGLDCYRRYLPDYKMGEKMAKNPQLEPMEVTAANRPARTCVRNPVILAERDAFWKCYFDVACSGPLP